MLQVIGKVSATEKMPSTIDNFYFWTDKGQILSPFDIVKVEHVSSNSDKSITYYNRGIQMYRFPNSDVQKSVIFEGIKKRLKIV